MPPESKGSVVHRTELSDCTALSVFFFVEEMTAQLSVASNDNASADPAEHTRQIPKAEAPKYSGRRYDIIQSSMMVLLAKKKVLSLKRLLDRPTIVFLVI
jgi:hypothetical protein